MLTFRSDSEIVSPVFPHRARRHYEKAPDRVKNDITMKSRQSEIKTIRNQGDMKSRRHEIKAHEIKATEKQGDIKLRRARPIRLNFMSP